MDRRNSQSP
ncbi:hypothetical protein D039_1697A, partial [Vibrio parahaemolyticus EKP-028]